MTGEIDIRVFRHVVWACCLSGGRVSDMEVAMSATMQGIISGRFFREEIRVIAEKCPILMQINEFKSVVKTGANAEDVSVLLIWGESDLRDADLQCPRSRESFFDGLFDRSYLQKIRCVDPSAVEAFPAERQFVRSTNSMSLEDIPRYLVPWARVRGCA